MVRFYKNLNDEEEADCAYVCVCKSECLQLLASTFSASSTSSASSFPLLLPERFGPAVLKHL